MVLETIDTINVGDEQLINANDPKPDDDVLSLLSVATERKEILESRDAGVAEPCNSIRSYANEMAASASLSHEWAPLAVLIPTVPMETPSAEEERRDDLADVAAEEEEPAAKPAVVEEPVVAAQPSAEELSQQSTLSTGPPRLAPITVTDNDECKLEMGDKKVERSHSHESHDSVKIIAQVIVVPEPEESNATEAKPVEEETAKLVEKIAAPVPSAVESEAKAAVSVEESPVDKEEPAAEESQAKPDSNEVVVNNTETAGKKKKFGLKLSKPNLSVPSMPAKPKKQATSPRGSHKKGMSFSKPNISMHFTKPSLGKRSKKTDSPVPQEEPVKKESASSTSEQLEQPAKEESASPVKEEEPKEEEVETIDLNDSGNKAATPEPPSSLPAVESKQSCSDFIIQQNTSMQAKEVESKKTQEEKEDDEASLGEIQVTRQVTEVMTKKQIEEAAAVAAVAAEVEAERVAAAAAAAAHPMESEPNNFEKLYEKAESYFGDVTNMCGLKSESNMKGDTVKASSKKEAATDLVVDADPIKSEKLMEVDASDEKASGNSDTDKEKLDATVAAATIDANNSKEAATAPVLTTNDTSAPTNPPQEVLTPLPIFNEQRPMSFIENLKENPSIKSIVGSLSSGYDSVSKATGAALFPLHAAKEETKVKAAAEKAAAEKVTQEKAEQEKLQEKLDEATESARKALAEDAKEESAKEAAEKADVDKVAQEKSEQEKVQEKLDKAAESAKKALDEDVQEEDQQEKITNKKTPTEKKFGFRRNTDKKSKPQLKIFAPKPASGTGSDKALKKKSKSADKSAQDTKKVARSFRLFKKPMKAANKESEGMKTVVLATPKTEAAADEAIASQDMQGDLKSTSLNSQSLNEPHQPTDDEKSEPAAIVEEPTPGSQDETSAPAPAEEPKQEEVKTEPKQDEIKTETLPPVSEEPKTEDAKTDSPASEEPAMAESTPAAVEEPKVEETPVVKSKSEETPVEKPIEEPKVEEPSL